MAQTKTSVVSRMGKYLTITQRDLIKASIMVALTAFVTTIGVSIEDGSWPTLVELKNCVLASLGTGVAYLIKNWLTNSNDEFLKKEHSVTK